VIDNRANRALRRSLIGLVAIAAPVVPALASAAVFEGQQTDPSGDSVIIASPYDGSSGRSMDLTGASVRYDSTLGELRIVFSGGGLIRGHSATSYSGRLGSASAAGPFCSNSGVEDLTFTGGSGTGSGGPPGHGSATLRGPIFGTFPDDTILADAGSSSFVDATNPQTVTFVFKNAQLARRAYQCAADFQATYRDSGNVTNVDGIAPFCLVAGCFDPLGPVTEPLLDLSPPTLDRTSYSPGDTIRAAAELKNTNSTTVTAKRVLITARPPGSTHANGPVKDDFPAATNISLDHGDVWVSSGSFTLPSDAPLGRYDVYLTYQTADGSYHDGLSNSFDVTADGAPLPFESFAPTVNGSLAPLAPVSDPARCLILSGKIKATTARMKLMQRASHKGSASHRRAVTRQVRVLASRRATQRATFKALCS
jgi:hypothetical protein